MTTIQTAKGILRKRRDLAKRRIGNFRFQTSPSAAFTELPVFFNDKMSQLCGFGMPSLIDLLIDDNGTANTGTPFDDHKVIVLFSCAI